MTRPLRQLSILLILFILIASVLNIILKFEYLWLTEKHVVDVNCGLSGDYVLTQLIFHAAIFSLMSTYVFVLGFDHEYLPKALDWYLTGMMVLSAVSSGYFFYFQQNFSQLFNDQKVNFQGSAITGPHATALTGLSIGSLAVALVGLGWSVYDMSSSKN
jgi:hypothetical protein